MNFNLYNYHCICLIISWIYLTLKNPAYGRQRISRSMRKVEPILLHNFIKKLQVMDVLFKETYWLCFALLGFFSSGNCRWWTCSSRRGTGFALLGVLHTITFFHQEIAGDGGALRGDRLALLLWDLLCSPGRIPWKGTDNTQTHTHMDRLRDYQKESV